MSGLLPVAAVAVMVYTEPAPAQSPAQPSVTTPCRAVPCRAVSCRTRDSDPCLLTPRLVSGRRTRTVPPAVPPGDISETRRPYAPGEMSVKAYFYGSVRQSPSFTGGTQLKLFEELGRSWPP